MATALITGASSGIGSELVKLFAADGDDVVLVARSESKLRELADRVSKTQSVKTTVIVSDLSKSEAVPQLVNQLNEQQIEIDSLVNNAGFGALGKFADLDVVRQTNMLMVNVVALTRLTRELLPGMLARNRGGILNVSSVAAYQAGPNMAVYYASKAYVLSFTEAIREELINTNLHITCLAPGPTKTEFGDDSGMSQLEMFSSNTMSASAVAKVGYRGYRDNSDVVIPGWKNQLMVASTRLVPRFVTRKIVKKIQPTK